VLEASFAGEQHPEPEERERLAQATDMTARRVSVWFQNRRAKERAKQGAAPRPRKAREPPFVSVEPPTGGRVLGQEPSQLQMQQLQQTQQMQMQQLQHAQQLQAQQQAQMQQPQQPLQQTLQMPRAHAPPPRQGMFMDFSFEQQQQQQMSLAPARPSDALPMSRSRSAGPTYGVKREFSPTGTVSRVNSSGTPMRVEFGMGPRPELAPLRHLPPPASAPLREFSPSSPMREYSPRSSPMVDYAPSSSIRSPAHEFGHSAQMREFRPEYGHATVMREFSPPAYAHTQAAPFASAPPVLPPPEEEQVRRASSAPKKQTVEPPDTDLRRFSLSEPSFEGFTRFNLGSDDPFLRLDAARAHTSSGSDDVYTEEEGDTPPRYYDAVEGARRQARAGKQFHLQEQRAPESDGDTTMVEA